MQNSTNQARIKGELYNYDDDFKVLSSGEKWGILKTAKNLLKIQRETALCTDALSLQSAFEGGHHNEEAYDEQ